MAKSKVSKLVKIFSGLGFIARLLRPVGHNLTFNLNIGGKRFVRLDTGGLKDIFTIQIWGRRFRFCEEMFAGDRDQGRYASVFRDILSRISVLLAIGHVEQSVLVLTTVPKDLKIVLKVDQHCLGREEEYPDLSANDGRHGKKTHGDIFDKHGLEQSDVLYPPVSSHCTVRIPFA